MIILKNRFASLPIVTDVLTSAGKKKSIFTKEEIEANYQEKNIKVAPKNSKTSENHENTRIAQTFIYTCITKDA